MAIPDFHKLMLPLLALAGDDQVHTVKEAYKTMADHFELDEDERHELIPSGRQPIINNRTAWAITYMVKAGLLERPKRGQFQVTNEGHKLLQEGLDSITIPVLERYPTFREFRYGSAESSPSPEANLSTPQDPRVSDTPHDLLRSSWKTLRATLEDELLSEVKAASPHFFERLVVDLLVGIGYGGSREEAGQQIGPGKDEGVDGVINEDPLGLDVLYLQAKRWESVVGRPEIQKFAGALQGQGARKGVFITTSRFTQEAADYADRIESRIVLIDGQELARLMVDNNVGVALEAIFPVKRIDTDYFYGD